MSELDTSRAVRQFERLLHLDTEGNPLNPPEDFAATTEEDFLVATITIKPDQQTTTIRRIDTNEKIIE